MLRALAPLPLNVQLPITFSGSAPAAQVGPFIPPNSPSTPPNTRRMDSAATNLHSQGGHGTSARQNVFSGRGALSGASGATVPERGGRGRGGRGRVRGGAQSGGSSRQATQPSPSAPTNTILLCLVPIMDPVKFKSGLESNNLITQLERAGLTTDLDISSPDEELWQGIERCLIEMLNNHPEHPRLSIAGESNTATEDFLQIPWQLLGPKSATMGVTRKWTRCDVTAYNFTLSRIRAIRPRPLIPHPTRQLDVLLIGQ